MAPSEEPLRFDAYQFPSRDRGVAESAGLAVVGLCFGFALSLVFRSVVERTYPPGEFDIWTTFIWGEHWLIRALASLSAVLLAGVVAGSYAPPRPWITAVVAATPSLLMATANILSPPLHALPLEVSDLPQVWQISAATIALLSIPAGRLGVALAYPRAKCEILRFWLGEAERGDARAQFIVGETYASGGGVPLDFAAAARWWQMAAEAGHAKAQYELGVSYKNGDGVPKDDEAAVQWWQQAAEQGHSEACVCLAASYAIGKGVPPDVGESTRWWDRSHTGISSPDEATPEQASNLEGADSEAGDALADPEAMRQAARDIAERLQLPASVVGRFSDEELVRAADEISREIAKQEGLPDRADADTDPGAAQ